MCRVPFVTERNNVMMQERSVLRWIESHRFGVVVDSLEWLPAGLLEQVDRCRQPLSTHSNRAVFDVAELVRSYMDLGSDIGKKSPKSDEDC